MPRQTIPLLLPDTAGFVRSLGDSLRERQATKPQLPGHLELLNLVARAAGYRNFQALKALAAEPDAAALAASLTTSRNSTVSAAPESNTLEATLLSENARKALQSFDSKGALKRWPVKFSVQKLAIWALWTLFDGKRSYTEREVNTILKAANGFGDHVTLRRELINHRLMARTADCSEYRKLPVRPDEETRLFLAAWRAQCRPQA
jgi:hypothetical protein